MAGVVTFSVGAVARGRARAESLMEDSCSIRVAGTRTGTDPSTGRDLLSPGVQVYAGPCRVQLPGSQEDVRRGGDRSWTVQRLTLSVPMSAPTVPVGAVVEMTATTLDLGLVGRRYRVVESFAKTHATARRLSCEEVTG